MSRAGLPQTANSMNIKRLESVKEVSSATMLFLVYFMSLCCAAVPLKLDFNVRRGTSINKLDESNNQPYFKRDGDAIAKLENEQTWYLVELEVGSNKNKVGVQIDTGSSDLWFPTSDVKCYQLEQQVNDLDPHESAINQLPTAGVPTTDTCTSYGSFNTGDSDTFHKNNSKFEIQYQDTSFGAGIWGYDDIVIADVTVEDLSFAVVRAASSPMGVLGLGLENLESVDLDTPLYANLPVKMKQEGIIEKIAYSLYLNSPDAASGSVLFGAVDHAKYTGTLMTVPVLNGEIEYGTDLTIDLVVALDGISFLNGKDEIGISTNMYEVLLDSGTSLTYVPQDLADLIGETLGAELDSYGDYILPCNVSDSYFLVFNFSGSKIKVPLNNFLVPLLESDQCIMGIVGQYDSLVILGDNFLRSAYVVYDLEDLEISIANVKYTDDSDIESIVSNVPSASTAPGYHSTDIDMYALESMATTTLLLEVATGSVSTSDNGHNSVSTTSDNGQNSVSTTSDNGQNSDSLSGPVITSQSDTTASSELSGSQRSSVSASSSTTQSSTKVNYANTLFGSEYTLLGVITLFFGLIV